MEIFLRMKTLKQINEKDVEQAKKKNATLHNVYFVIKDFKPHGKLKAASAEDSKERLLILNSTQNFVRLFQHSKDTRQACLSMNYKSSLCRCMAMYHAYVLDDKLNLNVYFRSMNYNKNIEFDIQTFDMFLTKLSKDINIKKGEMIFIINNLHPKK